MTSESDFPNIAPEDIIIDAIFGIGLNRCLDGWVKALILHLNEQTAFKLAIDIPSGLYPNSPQDDLEAVLKANHTLTFQAPKLSFFLPETGMFVPYFEVLDIGLDPEYIANAEPLAELVGKPDAQKLYKQRNKFDHKGMYGHALIVAGSNGKMGAAVLSAKSTFRAGAGLVSCHIPKSGNIILQTALPEAMTSVDVMDDIVSNVNLDFSPAAIGVGMGIGTEPKTVSALEKLFSETKTPMIIDADAINCISVNKKLLEIVPENSILTPHLGELERLVGKWNNDYDRLEKVKKFSKKYKLVLVIKGAHTIVVFDDQMYVNTTGNPGMATAGSGDVLAGVITGLVSQGYEPLIAAVFGVYLHGSAGNIISQKISFEAVMAGDICDSIGDAYLELFTQEPPQSEETIQE